VTRYRTAIVWGAVGTLLGGILSIVTGHAMGKLFSSGIIGGQPVASFALAVLIGTMTWVALASVFRLPVSTTHALVGSLIGAGLLFAPEAIHWGGLLTKVVTPLLVSIVVAYGISALLGIALQRWRAKRSARPAPALPDAEPYEAPPADGVTASGHGHPAAVLDQARPVSSATEAKHATVGDRLIAGLHWLSSGATCIARALNDTPKIAAVGAFALIPAGMTATQVTLTVAVAMALGSLLGIRVAKTLGERVVKMDHSEGFRANAITAILIGVGAQAGWPMSTTHVSTGAITGIPGANLSRLNGKVLRDFALAWTVTPVFGGLIAACVYFIAR